LSWLERLNELGYRIEPGAFGEQIIVENLDIDALQPGDCLQLGAAAIIEITKPRTGCDRLEAAQGKSREPFQNLVGMLARVRQGGVIEVGSPVRKL
jgi:MOSC domain-containing protein YiiM